jgi:anaerobic dimethyl sulfoxide reductase subunit C (anchor subunit)
MWNPLSRITEEAYWSMAFGVVLVIDFILSLARKSGTPRFLRWIGAVCGLGVMVATGLAYALNYGIPAWRGVFTFPLFLVGDIAMGCALYAVFFKVVSRKSYACAATIVYILYAVVLIGVGAQFSGAGQSMVAFIVALVIAGAVGVFCALYGLRAKGSFAKALPWIALVCVVAGTVVARYAFYAACTF